jgi:hypothetical protein
MKVKNLSKIEIAPGVLRYDFELENDHSSAADEMYKAGRAAEHRLAQETNAKRAESPLR